MSAQPHAAQFVVQGRAYLVQGMRIGIQNNENGREFRLQDGLADILDVTAVRIKNVRYLCQDTRLVFAYDRQYKFVHESSAHQESHGLWLAASPPVKPKRLGLANGPDLS